MDRYLSVSDKIKSQIDLIVNIEREKQSQNKDERALNVHVRASVNSAAFDSMLVGTGRTKKKLPTMT